MAKPDAYGFFWVPKHRRPSDYEFMQKWQPGIIKIQDGGDIDYA